MANLQTVSDASSTDDVFVEDLFAAVTFHSATSPSYIGWDSSSESLEYEDRKARLLAIIDAMTKEAPSWDGEPASVSEESAATAKRFLKALSPNRELPKVAPDGEGDVLLVWEPPYGNCIVTVQGDNLHMVDQPGSLHAVHIDAQSFLPGYRIPVSILHAIPMR